MSKEEKEILKTFEKVIPKLSEVEKARLLGFGEGLALAAEKEKKTA